MAKNIRAKFWFTIYFCITFFLTPSIAAASAACNDLLNFTSKRLHSTKTVDFCEAFSGKTLLVVNTASSCGFTPQFKELEALYQKYKDQNFEIVGFPSNSFRQEHTDEAKTATVCYKNYGVSFTMVTTSDVVGPEQNPVFQQLQKMSKQKPRWNFNKYLISSDMKSVQHFGAGVQPLNSKLESAIADLLQQAGQ